MTNAILIIENINQGDFSTTGVKMTFKIDNEKIIINLPANPQLLKFFDTYRQSYDEFARNEYRLEIPNNITTNVAVPIQTPFHNLRTEFRHWLNNDIFANIRNRLNRDIKNIFIQSEDIRLQMMPWEELNRLNSNQLGINICIYNPEVNVFDVTLSSEVQILAILAIKANDPNLIKTHLPDANLEVLIPEISPSDSLNPHQELDEKIKSMLRIDLIFFAGHSKTNDNFSDAIIFLTPDFYVTIYELEITLRRAKNKGLKCVIFNSCDGLGIISQLHDLNIQIPYIIVMRSPVHNNAAQHFLNELLEEFSQGYPLDKAFQNAKGSLRSLNKNYPNASELPLLFYNPNTPPLIYPPTSITLIDEIQPDDPIPWWKSLFQSIKLIFDWPKLIKKKLLFVILVLIVVLIIVFGKGIWSIIFPPKIPQIITNLCAEKDSKVKEFLSCGEKSLFYDPSDISFNKKTAMNAFNEQYLNGKKEQKNEKKAINLMTQVNQDKKEDNDPETLVFLNNSKIFEKIYSQPPILKEENILPLAVVLPLKEKKKPPYATAKFILQGVAYFQEKFNNNQNNKNKILLLIANDTNNTGDRDKKNDSVNAKNIAKELVKRKPYAVIGHYGSSVMQNTKNIYQDNQVVVMAFSATATTDNAKSNTQTLTSTDEKTYFFRVVSTNKGMAKNVFNDLKKKSKNIALFYSHGKLFSESFVYEFKTYCQEHFKIKEKNDCPIIIDDVDLDTEDYQNNNNKIKQVLEKAKINQSGIVICPNGFSISDTTKEEETKTTNMINNTHQIIKEKDENLDIGGCNVITTYKEEISSLNNKKAKKFVVGVPWSEYSPDWIKNYSQTKFLNSNDTPKSKLDDMKKFWGYEDSQKKYQEESMRMALGYDAALVLSESLIDPKLQLPLTDRSQLQKYLINRTDPFKGITGNIVFNDGQGNLGSDRTQDTSALITPDCSSEKCDDWKLAE